MSKPHEAILGTTKVARATKTIVYKGVEYRGRHYARIYGQHGSYELVETYPGDEFTCDAVFAKQAENAKEIVLLSGGRVTVMEQKDGFPIYESWVRDPAAPTPVYERCELLRPLFFGD